MLQRLFCLLILATTCLAAAPDKTRQVLTDAKEPVRIVCIGDSITGVYYHSGGRRAYSEMLQLALQQLYPQTKLSVHNAGISGDTTTGGLKRLDRDVLAGALESELGQPGLSALIRALCSSSSKQRARISGFFSSASSSSPLLSAPTGLSRSFRIAWARSPLASRAQKLIFHALLQPVPASPRALRETLAAAASSGVLTGLIWRPGCTAKRWETWRCFGSNSLYGLSHSKRVPSERT